MRWWLPVLTVVIGLAGSCSKTEDKDTAAPAQEKKAAQSQTKPAAGEGAALASQKDVPEKLELEIFAFGLERDSKGIALNPSIRYLIRNVSDDKVTFLFQPGFVDFWEKSVDGGPYRPLGAGGSAPPSGQHQVTLAPQEVVKGAISGKSYVSGAVSTIQLRYNRQPHYVLSSNKLDLSQERWGDKKHTDDPDCLEDELELRVESGESGLQAVIENVSDKKVTFFYETCPICFWSVSIDGGDWRPLLQGRHVAPCPLDDTITLAPGESQSYNLARHLDASKIETINVRFRYGSYMEKHLVLESGTVRVD